MQSSIVVENCPLAQECVKCWSTIDEGSLRVYIENDSRQYEPRACFHLYCFVPDKPKPLILKATSKADIESVDEWWDRWNSEVLVSEDQAPDMFQMKRIVTACPPTRRTLVEVFAYLTATEIDGLAAFICKEWLHVSRDEELWKAKYLFEFKPTTTHTDIQYRWKYIAIALNSCYRCHTQMNLYDQYWKCQFNNRPLCKYCHTSSAFKTVSVESYLKQRNISPSLLDLIQFRTFQLKDGKVAYYRDLAKAFLPYVKQRKAQLIEYILKSHPGELSENALAEVMDADLWKLYGDIYLCEPAVWVLSTFLGKDERVHDFYTSAEACFKRIQEYCTSNFL